MHVIAIVDSCESQLRVPKVQLVTRVRRAMRALEARLVLPVRKELKVLLAQLVLKALGVSSSLSLSFVPLTVRLPCRSSRRQGCCW